jgi:hypothetical protein
MSINRLNLQIGGGDQEDYEKRKVMREVTKEEKNIDELMEDLFFEEMVAPALSGEKPQAVRQQIQEEIVYREPRSNVDILSNYITRSTLSYGHTGTFFKVHITSYWYSCL